MEATFEGVLAFAFLGCMLMLGTVLRANLGFLQRALVPACLIGGLIGFALVSLGWSYGFENTDFTAFTFHFFTLSFMSLVLAKGERQGGGSIAAGGSWLSVIWVLSLVLQAPVGLAVILTYNGIADGGLSEYLGLLVTHGFTQGPGQALAIGSIWQGEFDVEHAIDFGLIYATVGFIVAFSVGVPVARWAVRKGLNSNKNARMDEDFVRGTYALARRPTAGQQVTHPANVDSLGYHLALLGVAYLITDAYLNFMHPLVASLDLGDINLAVLFTHNVFFLHGLMVCVALRALLDRFGYGDVIDDDSQRRITGTAVDFMVVATLMSIEFAMLAEYIVPLVTVCLFVTAATAALCFGFGRSLTAHGIERALTAFGCCSGSTGSGVLLLRMLDPDLSTPIARELAFFNIAILVFAFHILIIMAPILPGFDLSFVIGIYVLTFVVGAAAVLWLTRHINSAAQTNG